MLAVPVRRVRGAWLPLFLMIGAAAVPIIAFALVMLGLFNSQMERALEGLMQRTANGSAAAVEAKLREDTSALQALGSGLEDGVDAFRRQGERLLAARPGWLGLRLVDVEARLPVVSVGSDPGTLPRLDPQLLERVAHLGEPAIGGVDAGGQATEGYAAIYVPMHADGRTTRVIVAALSARSFSDVLLRQRPADDWVIALLDREHRILGRNVGHDEHVGAAATESLRRNLQSASHPFFSETKEGDQAFTAFSRSTAWGLTIAVGAPAEIVRAPMRRTMVVLAGGGVLALLLAVWLGLVVARATHRRQVAERRLTAIQTLQTAERRLSEIARNFPGVIYRRVLHPDGRVSYPYVSGTCGYEGTAPAPTDRMSLAEVGGMAFQPQDQQGWRAAILHSARTLEPFHYEGRAQTGDGSLRWIRTMAQPFRQDDGAVVWDGVALDITDMKLAEEHMAASLAEKEAMLREIHHRVRNNLQVVSSLIQIESFQIGDADARRRLADVSRRIGALGHLHELLYGSTDFARLDCGEHLRRLCQSVQETSLDPTEIAVEAEALYCDLDTAIPLGLLAHELVTFELDHSRRLQVSLTRTDCGAVQLVIDCGCGGEKLRGAGDIGSRIIHALAAQIDGTLEIADGKEQCVSLRIDGRRFG